MKLFYREFGNGKPFIIIHGLFGMSDNWVAIAKQIAEKGFRVILPDLRNHGQSLHSSVFDYPSMVNDLLDLFNSLCINKALICGHSMGGKVAMNFAIAHPDRVEKLIVADMGVKEYAVHNNDILDAMLSVDFTAVSSRKEVEEKIEEFVKSYSVRQLLMKNLNRNGNAFEWKLNALSIKDNFKNIFLRVETEKPFNKPVLFIHGELSDYVLDSDFEDIKKIFPSAVLEAVPNAGHWIHADNPEFFIESILDFSLA